MSTRPPVTCDCAQVHYLPNGTEWHLILIKSEMSIVELLVYLCGLQDLHFCNLEGNQPAIHLLVMSKEVLA